MGAHGWPPARLGSSGPAIYWAFTATVGRGFLAGALKGQRQEGSGPVGSVCCGGGDGQACGEPGCRVGPRPTLFPRSECHSSRKARREARAGFQWKTFPLWRGEAPAPGGNQDRAGPSLLPGTQPGCTCYPGCPQRAGPKGPGGPCCHPGHLHPHPCPGGPGLQNCHPPCPDSRWAPACFPSNQKGVGGDGRRVAQPRPAEGTDGGPDLRPHSSSHGVDVQRGWTLWWRGGGATHAHPTRYGGHHWGGLESGSPPSTRGPDQRGRPPARAHRASWNLNLARLAQPVLPGAPLPSPATAPRELGAQGPRAVRAVG